MEPANGGRGYAERPAGTLRTLRLQTTGLLSGIQQVGARAKSAWIVFFDESGVWLIPGAAHLVAALGYQPDGTKARLCFHLQQDAYDTDSLIGVLEQLKAFYAGQQMVLGYRRLGISTSSCRCAAAIHPERMM